MPAKKEYTAEFKKQAVRFVLEEIEPALHKENRVKQYAPGPARPAAENPTRAPRAPCSRMALGPF